MKIGIIGGGLQGLSLAYFLSKEGNKITLLERENQLGGLTSSFPVEGTYLEKFYRHTFKAETAILELIDELDIDRYFKWRPSRTGIFWQGKIYPFGTPLDLLFFKPFNFLDKLRFGFFTLYLRREKNWKRFENITAASWLPKFFGKKVYRVIWKPLLRAKFGDEYEKVSMAWFWFRIHSRFGSRVKGGSSEELGYFDGGYKVLVDALEEKIKEQGGEIFVNTEVTDVEEAERNRVKVISKAGKFYFDRCVFTGSTDIFLKIAKGLPRGFIERYKKIKHQGALCMILSLKKSLLKKIYWLNVTDQRFPFVAVIEHTNFVSRKDYQGKIVLYLGSYLDPQGRVFTLSDSFLFREFISFLPKLNKKFRPDWIENYWIFRNAYAQPVTTCDYKNFVPPFETPLKNVYVVNMDQIYPFDRGMNQAIKQSRERAEQLVG